MTDKTYILDANVFITAKRKYYAFDLAPTFWQILIQQANSKKIQSIDRVYIEICQGQDDLADWTKNNLKNAFISTDTNEVIQNFTESMQWVNSHSQFSNAAKAEFANVADGWIISYARSISGIVVTHEVLSPDAKKKVPIPNVCENFGVEFVDTFQMLRDLNVQL